MKKSVRMLLNGAAALAIFAIIGCDFMSDPLDPFDPGDNNGGGCDTIIWDDNGDWDGDELDSLWGGK